MSFYQNPFPASDADRHALWEILVARDTRAFVAQRWEQVAEDFMEEGFMGINARFRSNPDSWQLTYPELSAYRDAWLAQAQVFAGTEWEEDAERAVYEATTLRDIEIVGNSALLHKKFDGSIRKKDGSTDILNWQTLYRCRKVDGAWKIAGFVGYLPHPLGHPVEPAGPAIALPAGASQYATAGPYSPVLQVNPGQLVVISGQAALDKNGNIVGQTVEEQTQLTLENCQRQLAAAGCTLQDVFKVNVYLKDLDDWAKMNQVYKMFFTQPYPVRTAVQTGLLMTLLVEIELWAIKK